MPIEIMFTLTPGTINAPEVRFMERFHQSMQNTPEELKFSFSDPVLQALWAEYASVYAVQIRVELPPVKLRELVDKIVIRSSGQVFIPRKKLPELCKVLGINEANQTANALTVLTKPAHDQRKNRFPQVELLAVAKSDRDDINLTALCRLIRQDYFELAYLACETAGPLRLQYLQRFARMVNESQVLAKNTAT